MTKIQNRDYQIYAINLINNKLNNNIYISLPNGSGKTYIIIQSLKENIKNLILVPTYLIAKQIYNDLKILRPSLIKRTQCLYSYNNLFNNSYNITICVYDYIKFLKSLSIFNNIYIDEAHNIYNYNYIYNYVENSTNCILLSATINKPNKGLYFKLEPHELFDRDIIYDYNISKKTYIDYTLLCEELYNNYLYMIIYCKTSEEGHKICKIMNNINQHCCKYIDNNMPQSYVDSVINNFINRRISFIINTQLLEEGWNCKEINGVILIDIDKDNTHILGRCSNNKDRLVIDYKKYEDNN